MSWVNALSAADCEDYLSLSAGYERKTGDAVKSLMVILRLRGSIWFDERNLAAAAGVTRSYWRDRVWPAVEDVFEVEDGRLYHPEIERVARPDRSAERRGGKANALSGWGKRRERDRSQPAMLMPLAGGQADANSMQSGMQSHAKPMQNAAQNPMISTATDSVLHDFASASDARARPHSPSERENLPSESPEIQEEDSLSHGGEGKPRADARSMRTDANRHAKSMRTADAKPPPAPIAEDWQPNAAGVLEARKRGLDLEEVVPDFRDHFLHKGEESSNWDARFRRWCREEAKRRAAGAQRGLVMPITGGGAPRGKRDLLTRMLVEDIERQGRQAS
jgi:hypothetical protein